MSRSYSSSGLRVLLYSCVWVLPVSVLGGDVSYQLDTSLSRNHTDSMEDSINDELPASVLDGGACCQLDISLSNNQTNSVEASLSDEMLDNLLPTKDSGNEEDVVLNNTTVSVQYSMSLGSTVSKWSPDASGHRTPVDQNTESIVCATESIVYAKDDASANASIIKEGGAMLSNNSDSVFDVPISHTQKEYIPQSGNLPARENTATIARSHFIDENKSGVQFVQPIDVPDHIPSVPHMPDGVRGFVDAHNIEGFPVCAYSSAEGSCFDEVDLARAVRSQVGSHRFSYSSHDDYFGARSFSNIPDGGRSHSMSRARTQRRFVRHSSTFTPLPQTMDAFKANSVNTADGVSALIASQRHSRFSRLSQYQLSGGHSDVTMSFVSLPTYMCSDSCISTECSPHPRVPHVVGNSFDFSTVSEQNDIDNLYCVEPCDASSNVALDESYISCLDTNHGRGLRREEQVASVVSLFQCDVAKMLKRKRNFFSFSGGGMKISVQMTVARWLENGLGMRMFHFIDYAGAVSAGSITMMGLLMNYKKSEIIGLLEKPLGMQRDTLEIMMCQALQCMQDRKALDDSWVQERLYCIDIIYNMLFRHVVNVCCQAHSSAVGEPCAGLDTTQQMSFLNKHGVRELELSERINIYDSVVNMAKILCNWKRGALQSEADSSAKWISLLADIRKQTMVPKFSAASLYEYVLAHGHTVFAHRGLSFIRAMCRMGYFSNKPLHNLLKNVFGNIKCGDIEVPTFVLAYELQQKTCYVLHNQEQGCRAFDKGFGLYKRDTQQNNVQVQSALSLSVVDAIMASASLPRIFCGYKISLSDHSGDEMISLVLNDGGMYTNSALLIAPKVFPEVERCYKFCVTCGAVDTCNGKKRSCDGYCFLDLLLQKMCNGDNAAQLSGDIIFNPLLPAKYMGYSAGLNGSEDVQNYRMNQTIKYLSKECSAFLDEMKERLSLLKGLNYMVNNTLLHAIRKS